jgi:hypothetical protein
MAEEARKTTGAGSTADADEESSSEGAEPTGEAPEDERSGDAKDEESAQDEERSGGAEEEENSSDAEAASDGRGSNGSERSNGGSGAEDQPDHPTAPSLGPNTTIEREPVEERLARHDQSTEDAMGLDKRRQVIGKGYGPSKKRQLTLYGLALAIAAVVLIGLFLLVSALDTPVGKDIPQSAPWAQPHVKQHAPKPLQ